MNIESVTSGPYRGEIASGFSASQIINLLTNIQSLLSSKNVERLSNGPDYVVKLALPEIADGRPITIKVFKRQSFIKDWFDQRNKSKAERSFHAAIFLQDQDIGTPAPIAWLDRWEKGRLIESYYLCLFENAICFRDELARIYHDLRDNAPLMELLQVVAPAIRKMHDAGFMHGDMGNQNILLPKDADGQWCQPQFIDLNRCAIQQSPLNFDQRAFDISRVALPGAYLKIFKTIYCRHEEVPQDFDNRESKYRQRFDWHRRSRKFRRPLRYLKNRNNKATHPTYPPPQDIWLWDEKSAQPMIVLGRKEKHRYRDWRYMFSMAWQSLCSAPGIYFRYRQLLKKSYTQPVAMAGRIGVALHPKSEYIEQELHLLRSLGNPPVLIRFCHHETPEDWARTITLINQLHDQGVEIMAAFLQDREAVLKPQSWTSFLEQVIDAIADKVVHIEITHASNRVKWGIWSAREYGQLMKPAFALQQRYPKIKLTGPACIDFEYHPVIAALGSIPTGKKLAALSHLLYVDRRGAPESKQGRFSTLEKCVLLKALAQWSDRCEDSVIISEVNWPLKYTDIWSPIGCPYETPKWRREEPGETEDDYANYMLRYLFITLCSGHIEKVYWWRLSAHGYGLVDDKKNFLIRPAFKALQCFLRLLGEAEFVRKWETPTDIYVFEFRERSRVIVIAWSSTPNSNWAPEFAYQKILDRNGEPLEQVIISEGPIYFISND